MHARPPKSLRRKPRPCICVYMYIRIRICMYIYFYIYTVELEAQVEALRARLGPDRNQGHAGRIQSHSAFSNGKSKRFVHPVGHERLSYWSSISIRYCHLSSTLGSLAVVAPQAGVSQGRGRRRPRSWTRRGSGLRPSRPCLTLPLPNPNPSPNPNLTRTLTRP